MKFEKTNLRIKIQLKIVGGVKISKKLPKMWDLWTKSCGIFSTEGGETKSWDFQYHTLF